MLEENQKTLVSMSELVFYLNRDNEDLRIKIEALKTEMSIKNNMINFQKEQINRLTLEKSELKKKDSEIPDDYQKFKKELKEKDELLKLYEVELKKYRKEEKERREISKALGETIKEMKTK